MPKIETLSLTEINSVHGWMENLFRSFGMRGEELDNAIAETFQPAFQAIDRHRIGKQVVEVEKELRRTAFQVIEGGKA